MEAAISSINSALEIIRNAKLKLNGEGSQGAYSNGFVGGYIDEPMTHPLSPPPIDIALEESIAQAAATSTIVNQENSFMNILNSTNNYRALNSTNYQDVLDARAQYNLGNGDPMELFSAYMPNRAALEGEDLVAYDAQFDRILQHMNNTTILDDGLTADPSLKFILAASLSEVMAQSPRLVDKILSDINQGWRVSMDNSHFDGNTVGLYSHQWEKGWYRWELKNSYTANITLSLGSMLDSFVNPNDNWDILAHEVAHSIDRFKKDAPDGIPTYMGSDDVATLVDVRNEFFAAYNADNTAFSGLREYAYRDNEPEEFWAVASAYFLGGQDSAQGIYDNSPALYDVISRFYEKEYPIERLEVVTDIWDWGAGVG